MRISKVGANPIRDRTTPEIRGPSATKARRPKRSERYPTAGWGSDEAMERAIARAAAAEMEMSSFVMIRGSSGERNDAYPSLSAWAKVKTKVTRVAFPELGASKRGGAALEIRLNPEGVAGLGRAPHGCRNPPRSPFKCHTPA